MREDQLDRILREPFIFETLHERAEAVRAEGSPVFNLSLGCPTGRPPEHVIRAFTDALRRLRTSAHRHSSVAGTPQLRRAVGDWYERRFTVHLDPQSEILPLSSSLDALHLVLSAFIEEGDTVLVPSPCPPTWLSAIALARGRAVALPLNPDGVIDLDSIEEDTLAAARVLLSSYPHDPTGSICELPQLRRLLALCRDRDILLVNDVRWSEFALVEGHLPPSIFELAGAREGALEISTPTCSHHLGGWGVAFLAGGAERIHRLRILASHRGPGPFLAAQEATLAALTGDDTFLGQQRTRLRRQQLRFREGLRGLGLDLPPSPGTIFLWGRIPPAFADDDLGFVTKVIERSGVVLAPGSAFGEAGRGFVRVSLSLDDAAFDACLMRLEETGAFQPA